MQISYFFNFRLLVTIFFITLLFRLLGPALGIQYFSPLLVIAFFSEKIVKSLYWKFVFPLFLVGTTDFFINSIVYQHYNWYYPGFYWQYASYLLVVFLGIYFTNKSPKKLFLGVTFSSLSFFVFSNLGTWLTSGMYALNFNGLLTCYAMALPFFKHTVLIDLIFALIFYFYFALELEKSLLYKKNR